MEATHECDDGNIDDSDGCSAICSIEAGFLCEGGGPNSRDTCARVVTLAIKSVAVSEDFLLTVAFNEAVEFHGRAFNWTRIHN